MRPGSTGLDCARELAGGEVALFPAAGDLRVDCDGGVGDVAARGGETGASDCRVGLAVDEAKRNGPASCGLEEEPAMRLLAKGGIDQHALPCEEHFLGSPQAFGVGPFVPVGCVKAL